MWRSYFQVFIRNLLRQKTIAVINVLGLALGLCAFLTIGIYVQDEYSHESRWRNAERIVRLVNHVHIPGGDEVTLANVTELAAPRIKDFFPDVIERAARVMPVGSGMLSVNGEEFAGAVFQADSELIDIFDFEVLEGDLQRALEGPNRIALSEDYVRRIPGGGSPIGKLLTTQMPGAGTASYEVVAVYRLPPGKGSVNFPSISLWTETSAETQANENWFGAANSYFLLREGVDPASLAARLDSFVDQRVQPPLPVPEGSTTADVFTYRFQNIRDTYFHPNSDEAGGSQTSVNTFGAIAMLILAIGWSNFIILTLARSAERQREVGIRKTAGATGPYLLSQFVGEALLLAFVALVVALALLESTLPMFAALMQTTLSIDLTADSNLLVLTGLVLITGSIGGIYPALVLARQKPELVLKPGGHSGVLGAGLLRKALVSMQFLIATALIIATLVLYLQLAFLSERDPGFDTSNVVTLGLVESPSEVAVLRNAVAAIPGVEQTALASHEAATTGNLFRQNFRRTGDAGGGIVTTGYMIDYDFLSIYDMTILAGRSYDRALDGSGESALAALPRPRLSTLRDRIVLNATAARALGFANPADAIGAMVEGSSQGPDGNEIYEPAEIIGVVADNQFGSLRLVPGNEVYKLNSWASWYLTIKVDPAATPGIAAELQRVWQELGLPRQAVVRFADENVRQAFARELNTGRLVAGFAVLAILVACMGLYGLVAFETRRRKKEICIRSVLGGELYAILKLFIARFAGPVLWTNAFAWPLALWIMLRWLEQFPYRIGNSWLLPVCLMAGGLVITIVAVTVGATVIKVVESKPAEALRYE